MNKLRNFKCESTNEVNERLVSDDVLVINCNCGSKANRTLSAARYLGNTTGKYPKIR